MGDGNQTRQVMAAAHLIGQGQQPVEHGWHHVQMRDAVLLYERKQFGSIKARLQDHHAAQPQRIGRICKGGAVVERAGHHRGGHVAIGQAKRRHGAFRHRHLHIGRKGFALDCLGVASRS